MRSEWQSYQLGELFELTNGFAFKGSDFISSGVPVIKIKNVKPNSLLLGDLAYVDTAVADKRPDKQLKRGDILITMSGNRMDGSRDTWVGKVAYFDIPGRYMLNQRVGVLRPKKGVEVDCKCCAYFLSSDEFQDFFIAVATSSGGQANLSPSQILGEKISLPPLEEQERIASLLTALDDRITLLRETNATLEAIAQALFKSWFVDFDPVRAKMEGRTPEGMDEATAALFPDGLETSELGEVPRGWRVGQVADLGDVVCGKTPPTSAPENYGGDVPFITIPDMHDLLAVTTTARSLSKLGADSQPKKYLPPGAICVSCIATPGLVVRVTTTAQTNQQINSVIPHRKWGSSFPLFLLRRIGDAVRSGGSGGSVFHNLSKSGFEQLPVLLTEPELADRFNAVIDPLVEKIVANQLQTQTLSTLRDTLLPRLISGQLRLPEAQAAVEGAL